MIEATISKAFYHDWKDRLINEKEIQIVKKFGQIFDFDESFVMESINDLLSNKFISEKPFNFESSEIAKCFIKDSVTLILSDNSIDRKEYKWLLEIACSNNIEAGTVRIFYERRN